MMGGREPGVSVMFPPRPTELAWMTLREVIREGDLVIDATAGNGHDTVFLAEAVGDGGRVLALDVQESAIRSARKRVGDAGLEARVGFHLTSHARMAEHAGEGLVSAVMFNLGYQPGEDHEVTTEAGETIAALDAAAELLRPGGALSVICYPGHAAGKTEAEAVEQWMEALPGAGWRVAKYAMCGTKRPAPFLLLARKAG